MSAEAARARRAKQMARWETMRAGGMRSFVLTQGLGMYGTAMFVAMGLVSPMVRGGIEALTARHLAINAIGWTIGGLLFGATMWWFSERAYRKYQAEQAGSEK